MLFTVSSISKWYKNYTKNIHFYYHIKNKLLSIFNNYNRKNIPKNIKLVLGQIRGKIKRFIYRTYNNSFLIYYRDNILKMNYCMFYK
jgi:hypothetical protein